MGKRLLGSKLDKLTADERFRIMLAAAARQDTPEVERLARTCPRRTYSMTDLAYTERVRASRRVGMLWALLWERAYRDFLLMHVGGQSSDAGVASLEVMAMTTAHLLGVYLGLQGFCETERLDAAQLLEAWCTWLLEPIEDFLASEPFILLDDRLETDIARYRTAALAAAAETERLLTLDWQDEG